MRPGKTLAKEVHLVEANPVKLDKPLRVRSHRQTPPFQLVLPPRTHRTPSYHWLRDALREQIKSGMLRPGQRVPATREIARQYDLARGTVLAAIDDLKAEGYLQGIRGSGTFISDVLPERLLQAKSISADRRQPRTVDTPRISSYGKRVKPFSYFVNPLSLAFRTNLPALDLFPTTLWAQVASRRLRRTSSSQLLGCDVRGYAPLREVIAQYLRTARGVRCDPEQVIVVSGIQEALDLAARLLLNPGDRVLLEDPGYQVAFAALTAAGAKVISVEIDEQGAAPTRQSFRDARLMYVTPGHQFPTGITMPLRRRVEILERAREARTYIFEDDYDSEYRYSGSPIPAMQGIDQNNLVIFAGSFNKVLFPSLRMGYMVLPHSLVDVFAMTKALVTRHHTVLDQAVICDFIEQGHFGRHLRRTRKVYAQRLEALSYHARKHLSGFLDLSDIEAGLQIPAWLKQGFNAEMVCAAAAARKVDVVPISRYCRRPLGKEGLQVGFAAVDEDAIEKGVVQLARAFESLRNSLNA